MSRICNCDHPPGRTVCNDNQMAVCRVERGVCTGTCYSRPRKIELSSVAAQKKWALNIIMDNRRSPTRSISDTELEILELGEHDYVSDSGDTIRVKFSIPDEWWK